MSWFEGLSELRAEVMAHIDNRLAQIFGWTLTAKVSSIGADDAVEGSDNDIDPDTHQAGQRPVTRVEPWGHRGRAPTKVRALWLRLGSSNVVFIGIAPTEKYGPQDLDDGETSLYCAKNGTEIRLDKDGNIKINAASGVDVIVNAGTKKVARVDDTAEAGSLMATWMSQVEGFINGLSAGTVAPLSSTFASTPGIAVINSGADNFKG